MKDYFVNVVSSLLIAASGWAFNRYALGDPGAGASEFWSLLAVVALIGLLMVTLGLNRLRDVYVAAHSVDYKFYADSDRVWINAIASCIIYLLNGWGLGRSCACDELERGHAEWIFKARNTRGKL